MFEVVLKMYIHCEGCAKEVKHCIHDMEGNKICNFQSRFDFKKKKKKMASVTPY